MATNNAINCNTTGQVRYDANTGVFTSDTLTQHAILKAGASNAIGSQLLTDGQLMIGNSGNDPTAATLTPGTGVTIDNSVPGAITISSVGGGLSWSIVSVNASFVNNTGVIADKAGLLSMALPASSPVGTVIAITGINTAVGWRITQGAGQQIFFGTTSTANGVLGSLTSTQIRDTAILVCVSADLLWNVVDSAGNLTVA